MEGHRRRIGPRRALVQRPYVSGYVWATFARRPVWGRLLHDSPRWITGVVMTGGEPFVVAPAALAEMAAIPERLAGLREAKAREAAAAQAARAPVAGRPARFARGPLAGVVVEVIRVHGGRAFFAHGSARGDADAANLDRVEGEWAEKAPA